MSSPGDETAPWVLLHGAVIIRVVQEGERAELSLEQPELRARFAGRGRGFVARLEGCTELVYEPDDEPPLTDGMTIAASEPAILGASVEAGVGTVGPAMLVQCAGGTLRLRYATMTLATDTGADVPLDELRARSSVISLPR